jgi:hypothetical protein
MRDEHQVIFNIIVEGKTIHSGSNPFHPYIPPKDSVIHYHQASYKDEFTKATTLNLDVNEIHFEIKDTYNGLFKNRVISIICSKKLWE